MNKSNLINRVFLLITTICLWFVGVMGVSETIDSVRELKNEIYSLQNPKPTPALGFPIKNEPQYIDPSIINFVSAYNILNVFIIIFMSVSIFLIFLSVIVSFVKVDKSLISILQSVIIALLVILGALFLFNNIISRNLNNKIESFAGDLVNESLLLSLSLLPTPLNNLIIHLILCCIILFISTLFLSYDKLNNGKVNNNNMLVINDKLHNNESSIKNLNLEIDFERKFIELEKLKLLLDNGAITKEEYEVKKKQIIGI